MVQQQCHLLVAAALADQVIVVKHEDDRIGQPGHLVDQHRKHRLAEVGSLCLKGPQDLLAVEVRARQAQRGHQVPPQPAGIVIAAVERDPGESLVIDRTGPPLRHQGVLAEAGRRRYEDQPGRGTRQAADEFRPLYPFPSGDRSMKLRLDKHVGSPLTVRSGGRRRGRACQLLGRPPSFVIQQATSFVHQPGNGKDMTLKTRNVSALVTL
jgi:hypothetical protein